MTPEERIMLESTYKLAEENNQILQSIRRSNRFSLGVKVGYWVLIIALSFGAYYFIQPYVNMMSSLYSGSTDKLQSATDTVRTILGN